MSVQASQFGDELRIVKGEVAEVNRLISRLQSEIESVKAQVQLQAKFILVQCSFCKIIHIHHGLFLVSSSTLSVVVWRTSWLRRRSVES